MESDNYLLTYLLTPWSRIREKLTVSQLVKKFPAFYGTRRFITAFTSARQLSLYWTSSIQSITRHPTSWRSILILSSHLLLGLPSCLFPSGFLVGATYPAHLILLDFVTRTIFGEQYRSLSYSLCSFLHSPVTSSLLCPMFSSTPYSQTPSTSVPPSVWTNKGKWQLETATRQWIYRTFRAFHQFKCNRGQFNKQIGGALVGPTESNVLTVRYLASLKSFIR